MMVDTSAAATTWSMPLDQSSRVAAVADTTSSRGSPGGSPGARTPSLRIKSLSDHTAKSRISSDCNGFGPTQARQERATVSILKGPGKGQIPRSGTTPDLRITRLPLRMHSPLGLVAYHQL